MITRSRDNLMRLEEPANCSFTIPLEDSNQPQATSRGRPRTRAPKADVSQTTPANNNNFDNQQVHEAIENSMISFRSDMQEFIRNELSSLVHGMNIGTNTTSRNNHPRDNVDRSQYRTNYNSPNSSPRPNISNSSPQEPFVGEKVSNIIRNWRVKFTGCDDSMTVDEFIYRINVLTTNNLNGDFDLLCKHAHGLFDGKALDWYWRYHRRDNDLDWTTLTRALRDQYKGDYNDFDIMEDIHRRKQRNNENFDDFYDSVSAMTDRLKNPISDEHLCGILVRNLRNEIRHELIHIDIKTIPKLRQEVKRHEKFMKELRDGESRKLVRARVSEISGSTAELTDSDTSSPISEICAVTSTSKCLIVNCKDKERRN